MSLLANSNAIESGGYNIDRSLRFRSSASANLRRTFTTPTNSKICTISDWVKRGRLGYANPRLLDANNGGASKGSNFNYYFNSSDKLEIGDYNNVILTSNAVYRDPSAWYHIVLAIDTTQATATNRLRVYVNGAEISYTQGPSFPTQNEQLCVNTACAHGIGSNAAGTADYFDGYLAEVNFIDGQALTPSSFGQTDPVTGVWTPKKYTGTYGTNGFYLPFSDNTSATTLAYDKSGNGNNWTANNISTTAGATYDSMTDVPTLTSATAANFCTLNPLRTNGSVTLSAANLNGDTGTSGTNAITATFSQNTGKWYWEVTSISGTNLFVGISDSSVAASSIGITSGNGWYYEQGGNKWNGSSSAYGATWTTNDIIGVALDCDSGTLTFYKNGTSQGVAYSTGLTGKTLSPTMSNGGGASVGACNFGQRPFSYTPPTGFKALNTFNLPDPVIKKPNQYMDATLYTGTGTTQTVANSGGFTPDFVWIKNRSHNDADPYYGVHLLFNSTTGVGNRLMSQSTAAEAYSSQSLTAFNSGGFTVGTDNSVSYSGDAFVGWQWKKGATPGFDIVTYTGTGSARTVSHSLGVAPKMMIFKNRSNSGFNWATYHAAITNAQQYPVYLNLTDAAAINNAQFNNTAPTSSVFSVGASSDTNQNTALMVAYLFAEIAGFSKFGSYTGNGSTNGPFVYCGFRPKFIMWKRSDSSTGGEWVIQDTSRRTYNPMETSLYPNLSNAEASGETFRVQDTLSNGFKIRASADQCNANGGTYIYAAFAENPFKYSNAR